MDLNLDLGRLFSTSFAMFKDRFWPMLGLLVTFFAIMMALFIGFFVVAGASVAGFAALGGLADGDPSDAFLGGIGVSFLLVIALFYVAVLALIFAQQSSMTFMASPLDRPSFSDAMSRGFKAGLTFTALIILFLLVSVVVSLILALVIGVLTFLGGPIGIVLSVLLVPVYVYLACRLAILMPVVTVEKVFNPIKAVNRTWELTRGRTLGIFVALLVSALLAAVIFGVPWGLFALAGAGAADPAELSGVGAALVIVGSVLGFPLFIAYTIYALALNACLHAEISDYGAQSAAEVFQ